MWNLIKKTYPVIFCQIMLSPGHFFLQNSLGPFISFRKKSVTVPGRLPQHICCNKFCPLPKFLLTFLPALWISYLDQQVGRTAPDRYLSKPFILFNSSGDENILAQSLSWSFLEKIKCISAEYFVAMELSTHLVPCLTNLAKYFVLP